MSGTQTSVVKTENLSRIYGEGEIEVRALDGVSIDISAGEFVSIAGPSGSGKSTLLNLIGALDTPDAGEIWIGGERLGGLNKAQLADVRLRRIGFVFQAYNLVPVLSAVENVEFIAQLQGVGKDERRDRAQEMLAQVGLSGMEDRRPGELSGGQQQRVAIARALASQPDILLADEPSANLDTATTAGLMALLARLNEERATTIIMVTHDPDVMREAKRKLAMRDGRIVEDTGTP
ncbi:MAG: ABC transporter ATP-binding protein [Pseudomonadota bacterium]